MAEATGILGPLGDQRRALAIIVEPELLGLLRPEMRLAIVLAIANLGLAGIGFVEPILFGKLIESGSRGSVFGGYLFAAILMLIAAALAARYVTPAERRPLEDVATPLSAA